MYYPFSFMKLILTKHSQAASPYRVRFAPGTAAPARIMPPKRSQPNDNSLPCSEMMARLARKWRIPLHRMQTCLETGDIYNSDDDDDDDGYDDDDDDGDDDDVEQTSTAHLLPIWQSLPIEIVLLVLHELVSIHLADIDLDPFYPWETLRRLNHQQRRRIESLYPSLFVGMEISRSFGFYTDADRSPDGKGQVWLDWSLASTEPHFFDKATGALTLILTDIGWLDDEEPRFPDDAAVQTTDVSAGWKKYINSFPPGTVHVDPRPIYELLLPLPRLQSQEEAPCHTLRFPASHLSDVRDHDDDSITVSSTQIISAVLRAWKTDLREHPEYIYSLPRDRYIPTKWLERDLEPPKATN